MSIGVRDIDAELAVVAGQLNAAHARAAALIAEAIDHDTWHDHGIHTPEHWARLRMGLNASQARSLCTVARRWGDFPETMAEFTAGGLSLAQVEVVITRAPVWADYQMSKFAQGLSVSQLRSMIRDEFFEHEAPSTDEPEPADEGTAPDPEPGGTEAVVGRPDHFGYDWRDGRLVVHGEFGADRGTAIEALLEHIRDQLFRTTGTPASGADAFAELITRASRHHGDPLSLDWGNGSRPADVFGRLRTYLHLEVGDGGTALTGHLSNGVRLPQTVCDYLTCDGTIRPVWEHDHTPVGYGRDARIVPTRLRRLIEHRDQGCRVPGCGNHHTEIHHIIHWRNGGETETNNLVSLCPAHHRMHHHNQLGITGNPNQHDGLVFTDSFGKPINATKPVKPTSPPPQPAHQFEPASIERMTLHQFYGWTERGARTLAQHRARQHPPHPGPDSN